jgi:hypothetical protein
MKPMKLYTEEQVREMLKSTHIHTDNDVDMIIPKFTPIKLPSDEEVEKYLDTFPYTKHLDDGQYNDGQITGAELAIQWMRDKIQIRAKLNQTNYETPTHS